MADSLLDESITIKDINMRKYALFLGIIFMFGGFVVSSAQKIGVVDSDFILKSLPEYKEADERFNKQIRYWQMQLDSLQSNYNKKKELFENERILLVGEQLKTREKEVADLEKKVQTHLREKFTAQGEINTFRAKVVQPFQEKVWNAIRAIAEKNDLGIILDRSSDSSVLFTDKRYDYTKLVLDLLMRDNPNNGEKDKEKEKNNPKKNKK
jgi:outer membrane protein H